MNYSKVEQAKLARQLITMDLGICELTGHALVCEIQSKMDPLSIFSALI